MGRIMNPVVVALILLGLVAFASALGVVLRRTQTRVRRLAPQTAPGRRDGDGGGVPRATSGPDPVVPAELAAAGEPAPRFGEQLTVLQFSTESCARCPGTARVLAAAVAERDGAAHVEIDVTRRDELIARFSIMRTPTLLVLDADGRPLTRVSGPVGTAQARALLDEHLAAPHALEGSRR